MLRPPRWSAQELRVADRFVRALGNGRYRTSLEAARACCRSLAKLRQGLLQLGMRLPVRSENSVRERLSRAARESNLERPYRRWQSDEVRLVCRYVQAYLDGRYSSLRAAARECARELARDTRCPRPYRGVRSKLYAVARSMGLPRLVRPWSPSERRVLDRYARRLLEGRYRWVPDAARECQSELGGSHTYRAVCAVLRTRTAEFGLPRFHGQFTRPEKQFIWRYALNVHRGRLPDWKTAARLCAVAVSRLHARLAKSGPFQLRRFSGHTFDSIYNAIRRLARRRGLRGPGYRRWSAEENKVAASWVRWYDRYRTVRRLAPLVRSGEGIHDDLAEKGLHRSVNACMARLSLLWHRQVGR